MAKQNIYINPLSEANANNFWLTRPPPPFTPSQPMTPLYNLGNRMPFSPSHDVTSCYIPAPLPSYNLNYQNQYSSYNQSNSFPPLPDDIDEEYILKYLCLIPKPPKDEITIWIENWLASKRIEIPEQNVKSINNIEINQISNKVKECKILLENIKSNKQFMTQNISTMTEAEWKIACSNLFTIKDQLNVIVKTLNLDNNSMSELKYKIAKRKKKRDRLKRLKSKIKIMKSQQKDEIREINRKIDAWQNNFNESILKEKRVTETEIEANIVLKGVKGKIDDAKNYLSLFENLEKLRKCRLQNCVDQRKNALLEETLCRLKTLWQQKLSDYNREEEELKNMLSKAEAEKHEKREIEVQETLAKWDQVLFGPYFTYNEIVHDNFHAFLDIRRGWDKYVVDGNETPASSSIPIGWIIPSAPCNSDWAKYNK